jgi:hypothetical protein
MVSFLICNPLTEVPYFEVSFRVRLDVLLKSESSSSEAVVMVKTACSREILLSFSIKIVAGACLF